MTDLEKFTRVCNTIGVDIVTQCELGQHLVIIGATALRFSETGDYIMDFFYDRDRETKSDISKKRGSPEAKNRDA